MRWALIALALVALGCGGSPPARTQTRHVESTGPAAPGCVYRGELRRARLSTREGGWPALWLKRAQVTASLHATAPDVDAAMRFDARARVGGFELAGRLSDDALVLTDAHFFGPLVLAPHGWSPVLEAVESGRIRATIDSGRVFPRVRFRRLPAASLACEALGFRWATGPEDERTTMRASLGLASDAPLVRIRGGESLGLSATSGGPVLAVMDVSPGEGALGRSTYAHLLERGPQSTRVVFTSWRAPLLVAWVPSARLEQTPAGGLGGLGLVGGLGGGGGHDPPVQTFAVCTSAEPLTLLAVRAGGATEALGTIQPGQRFVRGRTHEQYLELAPHPEDELSLVDGVSLWITSAPLSCDTLPPVYGRSLRRLAMSPPLDLRASVNVVAVEGLDDVAVGSSCELRVRYRPWGFFLPCRAELRCGERVLYGTRSSNGYLACEAGGGEAPWLTANDTETSSTSGDAALAIDSRAGTLEIHDEGSGDRAAFSLHGQLEAFEASAAP